MVQLGWDDSRYLEIIMQNVHRALGYANDPARALVALRTLDYCFRSGLNWPFTDDWRYNKEPRKRLKKLIKRGNRNDASAAAKEGMPCLSRFMIMVDLISDTV